MSNASDPPQPNGSDNNLLFVALAVLLLVMYATCAIIRCSIVKRAMMRERVRLEERHAALQARREELEVHTAEDLRRQEILWHARVLAVLFPEKVTATVTADITTTMDDSDNAATATNAADGNRLMYDPETQRYRWTEEFLVDPTIHTCSICMDPFEQTDNVVTGSCDHTYHHHCMMSWLNTKLYKNDCPYCRQELWNWSTYDEISREIEEADEHVHMPTPVPCREQKEQRTLGTQ